MLIAVAGLLGLAVGSFLNVVIHRVPRGESVVHPPSRCPACGKQIRARHNVPVLGWLLLRGRCAACGNPISVRYPLVELGTGVLFGLFAWRLGDVPAALPAYLWFAGIAVALAFIDIEERRLPDVIVLPSYVVVAVLLTAATLWEREPSPLGRAAIGAGALFGFYLLLVLVYPAGMGWGDVKLSGLIGGVLAYVSWTALGVGAFAGFALGAVVGLAVIAVRRTGRQTALPFGPFMLAGAVLAILVFSQGGSS